VIAIHILLLVLNVLCWQVIALPLMVIGWFLVPIGLVFEHCERSRITGKIIWCPPRWMWLWGNDEDGYRPEGYDTFWKAYQWSALRNSVNNLRFVNWISPKLDPKRVQYRKLSRGWIAWQGWCVGLQYGKLAIGYRVCPYDAHGWVDRWGAWRLQGMGFLTGWGIQPEWKL
jgi:hypothetical protein